MSEVHLSISYCLCLLLSAALQKVNKQDRTVEVADRGLLEHKNEKKEEKISD